MNKLFFLLIILSLFDNPAFTQLLSGKQRTAAESYLTLIMHGQKEEMWQLFDQANVPGVSKEQYINTVMKINGSLAIFDTFTLASAFVQEVKNQLYKLYTFRMSSKNGQVLTEVFIQMVFFDTSALVGGIKMIVKPKDSTSLTSKQKETPLEKSFDVAIENVSYHIRGINIVHFDNNAGLLIIQVERKISPDEFEAHNWANREAVRFAKYLVANGYVDKAKLKAKELALNLVEDLGVSFVDPATEKGINTKLSPAEFK